MSAIKNFVAESNRIEGILREPSDAEIAECERFLALDFVTVGELRRFVFVYQPNATLRNRAGLNVRVGNHIPPPGSPQIENELSQLIVGAIYGDRSAYETHIRYETLHPFTDGNGRSGRMLWAWQMQDLRLGFLHAFYYQTLRYGQR